jgi:hypothetical protein
VTIAPQPSASGPGQSKPVENLLPRDAAALEAILRTDDLPIANTRFGPFLPFLSWLVSSLRPELTVDLGFEDDSIFHAVWRAAQLPDSLSTCIVVLLAAGEQVDHVSQSGPDQFSNLIAASATRYGLLEDQVEELEASDQHTDVSTTGFPDIHLLHLRLSEEGPGQGYLQKWFDRMVPGAVLVVPNTVAAESPAFTATHRYVADRMPATVATLGPTAEILVAQVPQNGATPLVDLLRDAPPAFQGLFALFAERSEFRHVLGPEPTSPAAVSALLHSLTENGRMERETFQVTIHSTRETMATLARESGALRSELVAYKEQVSLERAAMQTEYFGRLDELTAKLSTSAARYTRELTVRELALEAREREAEVLAGEAAEAQRRVAELLHSSSWRMTAPVRLLSRLIGSGRTRDTPPRSD